MLIETPRLRLQPHQPQALLALMDSVEAFRAVSGFAPAEGLREMLNSPEISEDYRKRLASDRDCNVWAHGWAIVETAHQLVIGSAGFKGPPDDQGTAEIAYGVVPAFEGRGHATEAAGALVAFARMFPEVKRICAHTLPVVNASGRVLAKLGFVRLGEVLDPVDGPVWAWELKDEVGKYGLIRVVLPYHLRNLARLEGEVNLALPRPVTIAAALDTLEARYPVLRGTIRDHGTLKRRPFIRFFACKEDLSLDPPETELPVAVVNGMEPFIVVGAMAGG